MRGTSVTAISMLCLWAGCAPEPEDSIGAQAAPMLWRDQQKITASDAKAGAWFGSGIDLAGDAAVIGAWRDSNGGALGLEGSVYVFSRNSGTWSEVQKIVASDPKSGHGFGCDVATDGDTLVVGARHDDEGGSEAGAAYVFAHVEGLWVEQQKLLAPNATPNGWFGYVVALDGDTIAVTSLAPRSAHVFVQSGGAWVEQQTLEPDPPSAETFGPAVALSGDTLIVGATGGAHVFVRQAGVWSLQQKLLPVGAAADANVSRVALDGNRAAVSVGSIATVFVREGTRWLEQQTLAGDSLDPGFGISMAIDGDAIAVGDFKDPEAGPLAGAVHLFVWREGLWLPHEKVMLAPGSADSHFGAPVALEGTTLLGGAFSDHAGENSGAVYAFTFVPLPNGGGCKLAGDCQSGFCVDGVCCDSACGDGAGDCQACSLVAGAAVDGVCGAAVAGTTCRHATSSCDAAEVCDGTSLACPEDLHAPDGASCSDDDACTASDACMAGLCAPGPDICDPGAEPAPAASETGCGCRAAPQPREPSLFFLALIWLLRRASRRR